MSPSPWSWPGSNILTQDVALFPFWALEGALLRQRPVWDHSVGPWTGRHPANLGRGTWQRWCLTESTGLGLVESSGILLMISSEISSGILGVAQATNAFKESQCPRCWGSNPHPWLGGSKLPCPWKFRPKSTRWPVGSHRLGAHPSPTVNERSRVVNSILHPSLWFLYTVGPLCSWVPHPHFKNIQKNMLLMFTIQLGLWWLCLCWKCTAFYLVIIP